MFGLRSALADANARFRAMKALIVDPTPIVVMDGGPAANAWTTVLGEPVRRKSRAISSPIGPWFGA